jgi:hypothetical protein
MSIIRGGSQKGGLMPNGQESSSQQGESGTELESLRTEIDAMMDLAVGDRLNLAYALLRLLLGAEGGIRGELLKHIAGRWDSISSSEELRLPTVLSQVDLDDLAKQYGKLVDDLLDVFLNANPSVEQLYEQIAGLLANPLLPDEPAQAFTLFWILQDRRIPYFQLDKGMRLSGDDWKDLAIKAQEPRRRIQFILASPSAFSQRSEEADLLLKELDKLEGPERVRAMGTLVWHLKQQTRDALDMLRSGGER